MPLSTLLHWLPGGGTILCFHGIRGEVQPDGGGIHVRVPFLRDAIAMAQSTGRIVPLREMIEIARAGRSSAGLVAITFDDACRSVAALALPILRAAAAPATIFAVRDASVSGRPFWWDRLSLVIPLLDPAGLSRLATALDAGSVDVTSAPRLLRDAVISRHRGALPPAADAVLAEAEALHRLSTRYDSAMHGDELLQLAADPLIDIGVHTCTHRALPLLSDAEIGEEITGCHRWLQDVVETVLRVLAIPYGLRDDRTPGLARTHGMHAVLRIAPRNVSARWNESGLPRFSMSERRSGWKLRAAMLGAYEWAAALGGGESGGDPAMPT